MAPIGGCPLLGGDCWGPGGDPGHWYTGAALGGGWNWGAELYVAWEGGLAKAAETGAGAPCCTGGMPGGHPPAEQTKQDYY